MDDTRKKVRRIKIASRISMLCKNSQIIQEINLLLCNMVQSHPPCNQYHIDATQEKSDIFRHIFTALEYMTDEELSILEEL